MSHAAVADMSRRLFLDRMTTGMGGVAIASLLAREAAADAASVAGGPPPKAKQVLQIFCPGAASHIDLWDEKPALEKFDGTPLPDTADAVELRPNYIYLFQRNLERIARDREDLIEQITITLHHELGHYLGLDEDEVEDGRA